jgi:sugar lactone lactonase YvrE
MRRSLLARRSLSDRRPASAKTAALFLFLPFVTTVFPFSARCSTPGIIVTVAGTGAQGFGGDGGPALSARFNLTHNVAVDRDGNLFLLDSGNERVRKIDARGVVTTFAGSALTAPGSPDLFPPGGYAGDGGPAIGALFNDPLDLIADGRGGLYVADSANGAVRRIAPDGTITTVAGAPAFQVASPDLGDGGPAIQARIGFPQGVAVDGEGNLYISDGEHDCVRKVTPEGIISTVAGNGVRGFGGDGGPAIDAELRTPVGLATDRDGNLYIADSGNQRIRKADRQGTITTVAGSGTEEVASGPTTRIAEGFSGDGGPATQARLAAPVSVAVDSAGTLYIADGDNYRVRKVTPDGTISTIAGSGPTGLDGSGTNAGDGGPATQATLYLTSLVIDGAGNLILADGSQVREVYGVAAPGLIGGRLFASVPGDTDLNGKTEIGDATLALQGAIGARFLDSEQTKLADLDGDGQVTVQDATRLLQRAIGL